MLEDLVRTPHSPTHPSLITIIVVDGTGLLRPVVDGYC